MGHRGSVQMICENNHYSSIDDQSIWYHGHDIAKHECHICKHPIIWANFVDDTNCDAYGHVAIEFDDELVKIETKKNDDGKWITITTWPTCKIPTVGGFNPQHE